MDKIFQSSLLGTQGRKDTMPLRPNGAAFNKTVIKSDGISNTVLFQNQNFMPVGLSILLYFFTVTYKFFLAPFFSAPYLMNSCYSLEDRRPHLECLVGTGSVVLP